MKARKRLREWRRGKGLTQHDAGVCLGVTANFIGLLERGERMPGLSLANLVKREAGIETEAWDDPETEGPDQ